MKRTNKGFTLVELIIVIAVIGVLAAILIPTFSNVIDKANAKSALSDARNTVTQYVTEAFENSDLPENIVVIIKKAGNYYLYGYNTRGDGSIQISGGNPYKKLSDVEDLVNNYSWNAKQDEGSYPDSGTEYTDAETYGTFYLVPYTDGVSDVPIKGFHADKDADMTKYPSLKDQMTEDMGENTEVFHGILLGGTYTLDSGSSGGSGTPATPKQKFTITFNKGNTEGNDDKVTLPNGGSVQVEEGTLFIPGNYRASYPHQDSDEEWYVFDGWMPADSFTVTGDAEITATWVKHTADKYTLSFDPNGGTLNLASGVTDGMQIVASTDITSYVINSSATRANYTFTGWTDGENTYTSSSSGITMNSNISLKAVWAEVKHTVTIDPANGESTYVLDEYAIGAQVQLPEAPAREGYVFDYWKTSNSDDTTHYSATGTYTMPGKDVTITAVWKDKYTVEYYSYDGTTKLKTETVNAGTEITMPAEYTDYAKPDTDDIHYSFVGWSCNVDSATYTDKYTVNSDVAFTAQYLEVPKLQVSFSPGELSGNSNVEGMPSGFKAPKGETVNPYEHGTPSYNWPGSGPKYTFDGWNPASATIAEESITFVAQWTEFETYTVTFDKGDGSSMTLGTLTSWTNGGSLDKGTDITALVNNSTATKANAEFAGWKSSVTNTIASGTQTVTANVTYTAQFNDIKYTVKYTAGEGTGSDYTQGTSYTPNQSITLATVATCGFTAPSGMAFDKWQSSISGEPTYGEGASYTVTANVTFTATWKSDSKTVTVKFYDTWNEQTINGGTATVSGSTVSYSQVQSLAPTYWVQGSTTTVSITTDNTVTFQGDRHNTAVSGDSGTDYIVVTTYIGMNKIGGIYSDDLFYPDEAAVNLTQNYWMLNDIAAEDNWYPIGWSNDDDLPFTGKFDGNGKTLSNINMGYSSGANVGLFAVNSGTIRNLDITMSSSGKIYGYNYVGAVAGTNNGLIEKIHLVGTGSDGSQVGTVFADDGAVGGITGSNSSGATVRYCSVFVNSIEGECQVGGIAGQNYGTVEQCYFKGTASNICKYYMNIRQTDTSQIGGIVGDNYSGGIVQNCYVNTGGYICVNYAGGGVVGYNRSSGTVRYCWVNANIQPFQIYSYAGDNGRGIGLNSGTSTGNYTVVSSNTGYAENGFNRISAATLTGYTESSHPSGWSTDIWSFTGSGVPKLKNWNRG